MRPWSQFRSRAASALPPAMEALVVVLVCVSAWVCGAEDPLYDFLVYGGIALLLLLWATEVVLRWRVPWTNCPVTLCLAAIFLFGLWQTMPLGSAVLERISPATAQWYARLLPSQFEQLPGGEQPDRVEPPAGSTLSLYPAGTRRELLKWLAVLLLFALVRNQIASPASFRRLCVVVLINGALLSCFGLVQFFTAKHNQLYWTRLVEGQVFGPFLNRNHFAFHANLCAGLGLGWLLSLRGAESRGTAPGLATWLNRPQLLWSALALALIVSSMVFCLSRGGFVALVVSGAMCGLLGARGARGQGVWGAVAGTSAAVLGLLLWLGLERVEARLGTLWTGAVWEDTRGTVFTRSWPICRSFPLWGTGHGTFRFIEPMYLHTAEDVDLPGWKYAHNEYLDALIEGGVVRLALTLLLTALVVRLAYRGIRLQRGRPEAALAWGGFLALLTLLIHNCFDFGIHIPANAVLATVLCAQLCAGARRVAGEAESHDYAWRGWGVAPLCGALLASVLGLVLLAQGWNVARVEQFRAAAASHRLGSPAAAEYRRACFQAAARLAPDDAEVQIGLGQAELMGYESDPGRHGEPPRDAGEPDPREHLNAALRHFLRARDLCPILPEPHVRLAAYVEHLRQADPREVYLDRARSLTPGDPRLWYLCGLQELADGQPERTWQSWRRSLELSDRFLRDILAQAAPRLDTEALLSRLLPDQPELLLAAADDLYPQPSAVPQRSLFLRKAVALLDARPGPLDPDDWHTQARLQRELGEPAAALRAYQAALAGRPQQVAWRFELAQLLYEQQRWRDAQRELRLVLDQQPRHSGARELADVLARLAAEGKLTQP